MVYFISDVHLDTLALDNTWEHQRRFIEMLNSIKHDATHIYLLGDIFDFWFEYYRRDKSKERYATVIRCLKHLTKRGIHVHFFTGNHDMWTFGGLRRMTGMYIHHRSYIVELCGKRIYMAHGDALVPSGYLASLPPKLRRKVKRFIRLQKIFHNKTLQFLFRCLPPKWGNAFGYNWAKKSRLKELKHPVGYKGEDNEELVAFAKEQEQLGQHCDYYVFGHRHIALDLPIATDSRVIILGDCFRQWTYAKMDADGAMQLCHYESPVDKK